MSASEAAAWRNAYVQANTKTSSRSSSKKSSSGSSRSSSGGLSDSDRKKIANLNGLVSAAAKAVRSGNYQQATNYLNQLKSGAKEAVDSGIITQDEYNGYQAYMPGKSKFGQGLS